MSCETDLLQGIIVGGVGGAIAGITVALAGWTKSWLKDRSEKARVYNWLETYTENKKGKQFRSTRAITSWNNMTLERAQYICSIHDNIFLSTGPNEDMWGIYKHNPNRKREPN